MNFLLLCLLSLAFAGCSNPKNHDQNDPYMVEETNMDEIPNEAYFNATGQNAMGTEDGM